MHELHELIAGAYTTLLLPKQDEGVAPVSSMVFENTIHLGLSDCNISDEFLRIGLPLFANVNELYLSWNDFTILPACIKECRFLKTIYLDDCYNLREIRGVPPNLVVFSAKNCRFLIVNIFRVGRSKVTLNLEIPSLHNDAANGEDFKFNTAAEHRLLDYVKSLGIVDGTNDIGKISLFTLTPLVYSELDQTVMNNPEEALGESSKDPVLLTTIDKLFKNQIELSQDDVEIEASILCFS
ncbi:hypothetical protein VNO77_33941 [Canavalia gladiata]|uniref:Uncharacterized protein n=1 Tax=Canavalia gladiata TaxID=3824 RepID=A0AAN9PWU1_CANGL